jgi:hypothetical protein
MSLELSAENYKRAIGPLLKALGFTKSSSTWRRDQGESIAVLNIQKSSWGGGTFYVNIGVYFHALGSESAPTENRCHVQTRLEPPPAPEEAVRQAQHWFEARATLSEAAQRAAAGADKGLVFREVRNAAAT